MQKIIEKIRGDAKKKADAILKACEKDASLIREQAIEKAKEILNSKRELAKRDALIEERREIAKAVLLTKKERAAFLDSKLEEILGYVKDNLETIRKEKEFQPKLKEMLLAAIKEIPTDKPVIECSKEDYDFVAKTLNSK
ncbi:MAG: V-type ATP synthase subunit E family protein, partial [Candidatus Diapherotrites archaeon]